MVVGDDFERFSTLWRSEDSMDSHILQADSECTSCISSRTPNSKAEAQRKPEASGETRVEICDQYLHELSMVAHHTVCAPCTIMKGV